MTHTLVSPDVAENMKDVKHKIVVLSGKGGVGKTTIATNLAISFAQRGKTSGILDVDIYGPNVPKLLGLEGQHPIAEGDFIIPILGPLNVKVMSMAFLLRKDDDAVAWRGPLVAKAISQFLSNVKWGDIDGLVIVSTPQEVAVLDARRAIQLVEKMGVPILGIVENMSEFICPKCGESYKIFGEGAAKSAAEEYGIEHLGTLPLDPRVITLSDKGTPFVIEDPDSQASKSFNTLVDRLASKMKLK
jgi:ATP-binding protein involved in chromosome partitioning